MAQCVITGCSLVDPTHATELHGDLHEQGDQWIFNAVGSPTQYGAVPTNNRYLAYNVFSDFFERRNVYIIPKAESALSPDAENYILRAPR